ncbi:B3 domain-containing transcription factor ABI3 isoform X2 [Euphorbia lathyris]|uniref:B3 domain-containing transcription factor ABI3 isoform X2 n=1 Tax=Euphorbia lathyris TaxID=212925 RepID=UPI003313B217
MATTQLHVEDVKREIEKNPMEKGVSGTGGGQERQIWLGREEDDDLLDVSESSIFYADFPQLPDFPCMSSTSSSSSAPAPVKASATSSSSSSASSAASWAVLKSDADDVVHKESNTHDQHQNQNQKNSMADLSSTGSMEIRQAASEQGGGDGDGAGGCMDVMENFGYMDLMDDNEFFDPSSIFSPGENFLDEFEQEQQNLQPEQPLPLPPQQQGSDHDHEHEEMMMQFGTEEETAQQEVNVNSSSDDLAMVFLEWLKLNKETVSAEDLRKVKIKKATIECAAKRLGGGKEAMKQLLKLILEWVQTNHLQKRRMNESELQNPNPTDHPLSSNPSLICNSNCNSISISNQPDQPNTPCFTQSPWIPPPSYAAIDPVTGMPGYSPMVGYPYANGAPNMSSYPGTPTDYRMLESAQSWPPTQFPLASHYNSYPEAVQTHPPVFTGYGNQYPCQYVQGQVGDSRLVRLGSSATKEARKKRMERQRRFISHPRNHNHNQNHHHHNQSGATDGHHAMAQQNPGNWVYCYNPPVVNGPPGSTGPVHPMDAVAPPAERAASVQAAQNHQPRQVGSDKRQNWKPEKNLRFLLQKVLKQSDVGTLGRIVLPKKEAETHLPELEARDGISIAMEDIGTSRVWNMRYRFWPNNKSRMYLLENTGDFVRTNGLQEGDFIVIYSDVKCGKYLIRGVKVRQAGGSKAENKKGSVKSQKNTAASSPGGNGSVNQKSKVKEIEGKNSLSCMHEN